MSFTYNGNPANDRDAVRLMIGDTVSATALLTDEEIDYVLGVEVDTYSTAAALCRSLAARFARDISTSADGVSVQRNQRHEQFKAMAEQFEAKAGAKVGQSVAPYSRLLDATSDAPTDPIFTLDRFDVSEPSDELAP